jgi:hypothetical protein
MPKMRRPLSLARSRYATLSAFIAVMRSANARYVWSEFAASASSAAVSSSRRADRGCRPLCPTKPITDPPWIGETYASNISSPCRLSSGSIVRRL